MSITQQSLDKFGKRVVKESKTALTKKKKNASKRLYNSISYDLNVSKNSFSLSFNMEDYGEYIDKGVHGIGGTKADGSPWVKRKTFDTEFRYKDKRPPSKVFSNWIVLKGFAPRNKKGQFTSRKGLQYAIANSVYHKGLETTQFFTNPFENAFKVLPEEVTKSYALDVEDFLKFVLK